MNWFYIPFHRFYMLGLICNRKIWCWLLRTLGREVDFICLTRFIVYMLHLKDSNLFSPKHENRKKKSKEKTKRKEYGSSQPMCKEWYNTFGTGGGFLLHTFVKSLHKYFTKDSSWGLRAYIYSAISVSENPTTCIKQLC